MPSTRISFSIAVLCKLRYARRMPGRSENGNPGDGLEALYLAVRWCRLVRLALHCCPSAGCWSILGLNLVSADQKSLESLVPGTTWIWSDLARRSISHSLYSPYTSWTYIVSWVCNLHPSPLDSSRIHKCRMHMWRRQFMVLPRWLSPLSLWQQRGSQYYLKLAHRWCGCCSLIRDRKLLIRHFVKKFNTIVGDMLQESSLEGLGFRGSLMIASTSCLSCATLRFSRTFNEFPVLNNTLHHPGQFACCVWVSFERRFMWTCWCSVLYWTWIHSPCQFTTLCESTSPNLKPAAIKSSFQHWRFIAVLIQKVPTGWDIFSSPEMDLSRECRSLRKTLEIKNTELAASRRSVSLSTFVSFEGRFETNLQIIIFGVGN